MRTPTRLLLAASMALVPCAVFVTPAEAYPSGFRLPFAGPVVITSGPDATENMWHDGASAQAMDFQAKSKAPFAVYAVSSGIAYVLGSSLTGGFGDLVMIDHGNNTWSMYAHMGGIAVSNGQRVQIGQRIGETGNSGNGSGNHLHFEIRTGVTFNGSLPDPFTGAPVVISDHPSIHYSHTDDCCNRGYAEGEQVSQAQPVNLGQYYYDTRALSATLSQTLESGHRYLVTVAGTYSLWSAAHWNSVGVCAGRTEASPQYPTPGKPNGSVMGDAEWRFALPCTTGERPTLPSPDHTTFNLSLDGGSDFTYISPTDSAFNPAHVYQYQVTGRGQPLAIRFYDTGHDDNYGLLRITITPMP